MMLAAHSIPELIAAHRVAIRMDEAAFNDAGQEISGTADESDALEKAIMRALIAAPCASSADVNAKLDYVLNGTVGERVELIDAVTGDDWTPLHDEGGALKTFLRSLILSTAPA